eukprot:scaffold20483_cov52-Phaeocystis_antarctica.AAC.1
MTCASTAPSAGATRRACRTTRSGGPEPPPQPPNALALALALALASVPYNPVRQEAEPLTLPQP